MQNKFKFHSVTCFFYSGLLLLTLSLSQFFSGCSGSDEVEEITQRDKDSMEVYTQMQRAFSFYKEALVFNQASDEQKANSHFESALRQLNKINYEVIQDPENYFWKQDYNELAQSIVEDYLITQSEIIQSSLVFEFAKKVSVNYEKVEQFTVDREALPDGSDVPLIRNSVVDGYIEFFSNTDRGRSFIDKCLYRSGKYFHLMRDILKYNNAPEELIYLSVQESGLSPTIVSRAGAVGLWQFMPSTGYAYGLSSDGYRDDRRDFEKSTDAAARHLKDLYRTFDDWYLAFAAYNAGPGRVRSAIRKSGSTDFWALRGYLPGETKNYVPSILALSFVLRNPEAYGFNDIEYGSAVSFDRVNIECEMSLQKVAELCETDIETIRDLNPELTSDIMPNYNVPYQLRIPHKSFTKFAANYENASDISKSSFSPEFAGDESASYGKNLASVQYKVKNYEPVDVRLIGSTNGRMKVTHKFKKKEALASVAIYYSVRPVEIRIWNDINYGNYPKSKQELAIYVSEEKYHLLQGQLNKDPNTNLISENSGFEDLNKDKADAKDNDGAKDIDTKKVNEPTAPLPPELNPNPDQSVETKVNTKQGENKPEVDESAKAREDAFANSNSKENISVSTVNESTDETSFAEHNSANTTGTEESGDESEYFEQRETKPVVSSEQKSQKTISSKNSSTTYTVSEGDNLTEIAASYGVSVSELMEWNGLDDDKILVGQRLRIYSSASRTSTHTVTAGENLTMIANEYGLSLSELKDMNDIDGDVIFVGQKLRVVNNPSGKTGRKTSGVKKTYKVRKGDTLASISEENDISIRDLKQWNNIKGDKILIGQILKLYK